MNDTDDRLEEVISAYRAAHRPTTDARTAYRLLARRIEEGDFPIDSDDGPSEEPRLSWSKSGWALTLVAAAAIMAITAVVRPTSWSWSTRPAFLQASHVADSRNATAATAGTARSIANESVPSEPQELRQVDPGAPPAMNPPARSKPRGARAVAKEVRGSAEDAPAVAEGDLGAEMELLERGQWALTSGDAARALQFFERHAKRYPTGVLAEERMVKRMVALCELGRGNEARAEARRFVAANPTSPLCAHAATICKEKTGPKQPGDGNDGKRRAP